MRALDINAARGLNLIDHTLLGQDSRSQAATVYRPQIQSNRMREGNGCGFKKDLMTKVDPAQATIVQFCPIMIVLRRAWTSDAPSAQPLGFPDPYPRGRRGK
jgi:hypothetical protein